MGINNESLGVTAEKVICDLCNIDSSILIGRSVPVLERQIKPYLADAIKKLPPIKAYVGQERGSHGSQSKSPIDFILEGQKTLSVKTNKTGKKVCPSRCGQPGNETFDVFFRHLYEGFDSITYNNFKKLALKKTHLMMPIYIENTFDCDYVLWLCYESRNKEYKIINKEDVRLYEWKKEFFTFSKPTVESWNESCTVKYKGISLGEYQVHNHRNNYKFRFHFDKLCRLLGV